VILRPDHLRRVARLLSDFPVVGLIGARQVGKTTLAGNVSTAWRGPVTRFDLEDAVDVARLRDPFLALGPLRGLVVIDEVQRTPDLFPALRVLADRPRRPARFLVLGSASPAMLRQSAESLAGRIAYYELGGLSQDEVTPNRLERLWLRGGFPRSFLARSEEASLVWRTQLVRTYLERDVPGLALRLAPTTLARFWAMLAHWHGQLWNASELGRSFGVADTTVRQWLDVLASTFMVRVLPPWTENLSKRQVKSPRVFVADSGILHSLLDVRDHVGLERHPKLGASWEGFAMAQVVRRLAADWREAFFWSTYQGAELDLLVVRGRTRRGFEFKRSTAPTMTRSMHVALADLGLNRLEVIHAGEAAYPLAERIRAVPLRLLQEEIEPLG
jgi:uncharacterized protein